MTDLTPNAQTGDLLMNQTVPGSQSASTVAALTDGTIIVTWLSEDQDGDDDGVFARRFDTMGVPLGGEFQVNTVTTGPQTDASVAALEDGGYVITWTSQEDGSGTSIHGRLYNANGTPQGAPFRINTTSDGDQQSASVTGLDGGGFAVTWSSFNGKNYDVFVQRFDSAGVQVGAQLDLDSGASAQESISSVTALTGGGFLAAWHGATRANSVSWELFSPNGISVNAGTIPNSDLYDNATTATIAGMADGGFIIAWLEFRLPGDTFAYDELYYQKFDAAGNALHAPTLLEGVYSALPLIDRITDPSVTALPDGSAVVAWDQNYLDQSFNRARDVFMERIGPDGTPAGGAVRVNDIDTGTQQIDMAHGGYSLDTLPDGRVVVTWNTPGDDADVYSRIFALPTDPTPLPVAPETTVQGFTAGVDHANVAALAGGGHVVVWSEQNGDADGVGIRGRLFREDGGANRGSFQVNFETTGDQRYPAVAALKNGSFSNRAFGSSSFHRFVSVLWNQVSHPGQASLRSHCWPCSVGPLHACVGSVAERPA